MDNWYENLCSLKYSEDKKHIIFIFLGIKMKFKNMSTYHMLSQIQLKLATPGDIYKIKNIQFYLPNYPVDTIQCCIVNNNDFYEIDLLKKMDKYVPDNASILDIGANIGNHSLYWATQRGAKKIFSFEPISSTYNVLSKNIEINNLPNIITAFNLGLSDEDTGAEIACFSNNNIGGTCIKKSDSVFGGIKVIKLDSLKLDVDKIDFMKIDVEGHELFALKGAKQTIAKYKPLIFMESFPQKFPEAKKLLSDYGYRIKEVISKSNYIFEYVG